MMEVIFGTALLNTLAVDIPRAVMAPVVALVAGGVIFHIKKYIVVRARKK